MKKNVVAERGKANVERALGAIQEGVGHVIGDEKMEARGAAHQEIGDARDKAAMTAERIDGAVQEITGVAKHEVGHLRGDTAQQVEGKIQELTGQVRQALNK